MNKHIISILLTPNCHNYLVAYLDDGGIIKEELFSDSESLGKFLIDYFYIPEWEKF